MCILCCLHHLLHGLFQISHDTFPPQMDASTKQQQRLLANLPFFPEARHDSCQRRVLLRNVSLLDLAPCANYYAYKVNRFLFWGPADLDNLTAGCPQGQDHLAEVTDAPDTLVTAGLFGPQRILSLEWEESVKLSWLQHESKSESPDSGVEGVLVARSAGVLFSTLSAVLTEAPLYVKVLLCRHICAVLKVIVHRAGHKSELELMDASEIPEDLKITEDILYRALTLLEIAADSRCMVSALPACGRTPFHASSPSILLVPLSSNLFQSSSIRGIRSSCESFVCVLCVLVLECDAQT